MSQATVEELMEELYALVEKAVKLPLSGGRTVLDGEEVKAILDEMRDHLPQETRQARANCSRPYSNSCRCKERG